MKLNSLYVYPLLWGCLCMAGGCSDDKKEVLPTPPAPAPGNQQTSDEIYYANLFAADVLSEIYVWNKEISGDIGLLDPDTNQDPIATVRQIRYKKDGKEVDKWTMLTDGADDLNDSMQGVETSFGYSLSLGRFSNTNAYFFVVNYVYADSPAQQAGLKRGDIIMRMDGEDITEGNYLNAWYHPSVTLGLGAVNEDGSVSLSDRTVDLVAVKMYENPILSVKTFEFGGKKVGYLAYDSFDVLSAEKLVDICRDFKDKGVSELILDLRYNGGGYVFTEEVLASMLAPAEAVSSKAVYQTEVWNDAYMKYYRDKHIDLNTYFSTTHSIKLNDTVLKVDTKDANIGLKKIYALIGSSTASASEGLLIGLMPYMDVELIGSRSHGKYCTGAVLQPADVYEDGLKDIEDWGIYVMLSRYADKDGNNPCMPDGLQPDVEQSDAVLDGYQLGEEGETLLRVALQRAGMPEQTSTSRALTVPHYETTVISRRASFGKRIGQIPMLKQK